MESEIARLLVVQSGVISRRQVLAEGCGVHDIRRKVRRREWARLHPGVYVNHTGPPTWEQQAWAAVLAVAPAALSHESAVQAARRLGGVRGGDEPIHVAVDRRRMVAAPGGVVLHQLAHLDTRVHWNLAPPRVRIEQAVLDVAASATDDFAAIAALASVVQSRQTTAARIRAALDSRRRISRRPFLAGVLDDVALGTCSVLEHGYLDRVERPHGLPCADRQLLASARGPIYRDVDYAPYGVLVELDGRLFHDNAVARDRDLDRDLDAAVEGKRTVRLGWGQVFGRPCVTAGRVGLLLKQGGWSGRVSACPECA